ncbi:hypothetical protein OKJ48_09060 [Streptomyces kunmingensis]|uniref:Secreted protein n=1 Tax=Streptomyces kunmingensis TaxID=68225 RepID=A0ABU6C990_9ACTN|nr:hypothetical protein [Streptomyces kunmingensis]MEB3960395.1 hypothetical protein [Streptomyces kunmingensis]
MKNATARKRIQLAVGGLAAAATLMVATSTPALAGTSNNVKNSTGASIAWFWEEGDHLQSSDQWQDGHGSVAEWRYSPGSTIHEYYNGGGFGVTKSWNLNFTEGKSLQIRSCLADGSNGTPFSCGSWVNAKA